MVSTVSNTETTMSNTKTTVSFNKWGRRQIETPIGNNIRIKFNKKNISLGITYYKGGVMQKLFGLTFEEFLSYIKREEVFSMNQRKNFIRTYQQTFSLEYLRKHFRHWKDIENDIIWKQQVTIYLQQLCFNVLKSINDGNLSVFPRMQNSRHSNNKYTKQYMNQMHKTYTFAINMQQTVINKQNYLLNKKDNLVDTYNNSLVLQSNKINKLHFTNDKQRTQWKHTSKKNQQLARENILLKQKNHKLVIGKKK
eukprot:188279_1